MATRRSHPKSRNGCIICKQRKIKCDESRPTCASKLSSIRRQLQLYAPKSWSSSCSPAHRSLVFSITG
ncbi:hypothetical protein F5Y00DRAFT_229533 [Daldinia vernicosa]|uniref:uncharacterized protein n=1 Tax=Daldinia vernicosa TaxID=114800 RepID=UPI002007858C|nr:uncharacterized protein F5Y00DRAFT_229533 [Daldinia vernicosa]KAI0851875.1 hypothetical protein F5Y00DRAFT_229533 [Daldinia vernicosa]